MAVRFRTRFRGERATNIWPGFVDALAALLLVIVFLLSIFVLAQFFLGQTVSGQEQALEKLNLRVAELGELLDLERLASADMRAGVAQLSTSLQVANEARDRMAGEAERASSLLSQREASLAALEGRASALGRELDQEKTLSARAREQVELLNQQIAAVRQQLGRMEAALDAAEQRDIEQQAVVKNLGRRLNQALAQKVEELGAYRSEFFGRLKILLGGRPGISIVGDRFVFQSEVLFRSGSDQLEETGKAQLSAIAATLLELGPEIPPDLNWLLRVDGHTDRVPIRSGRFPSNWELSAARAISVIRYLTSQGVAPSRLAAAGFGEHQPLDPGTSEAANAINRRIELKLTTR